MFCICAFRGRDESSGFIDRENFLEMLNLLDSYNDMITELLDKAPRNASYTSPLIQKEILHIFQLR